MGANIKYKASLFSFLFSEPDVLRELYCALENVNLPSDVPVNINTLQDVLFMDMVNDISFEIGGKLIVLIEHQSTINPNMCLRLLMYIARVYEKLVGGKKIYSTQKIPIPQPEFFVLYNGTSSCPDESVLKLSDAFENISGLGLEEKQSFALELTVKVLNINEGRNEKIVKKCKTLSEYSAFIAKVREYENNGSDRKTAITKAAVYCRNNDILKGFLENNASEVLNMLTTEWNWEDARQVWLEEGREEGLEEGIKTVARNALAQGFSVDAIQLLTGLDKDSIKSINDFD